MKAQNKVGVKYFENPKQQRAMFKSLVARMLLNLAEKWHYMLIGPARCIDVGTCTVAHFVTLHEISIYTILTKYSRKQNLNQTKKVSLVSFQSPLKKRVDSSHGFSSVYFFDAPEVTQRVLSKVAPVGPGNKTKVFSFFS